MPTYDVEVLLNDNRGPNPTDIINLPEEYAVGAEVEYKFPKNKPQHFFPVGSVELADKRVSVKILSKRE